MKAPCVVKDSSSSVVVESRLQRDGLPRVVGLTRSLGLDPPEGVFASRTSLTSTSKGKNKESIKLSIEISQNKFIVFIYLFDPLAVLMQMQMQKHLLLRRWRRASCCCVLRMARLNQTSGFGPGQVFSSTDFWASERTAPAQGSFPSWMSGLCSNFTCCTEGFGAR